MLPLSPKALILTEGVESQTLGPKAEWMSLSGHSTEVKSGVLVLNWVGS